MTATMPRPGATVVVRSAPAPRSVPTATGPWFVAGLADKGPLAPVLVRSLNDFITNFGLRQSYSVLYDAMETYFREGGGMAYISRVVGPAAASAVINLDGPAAGAPYSLTATAKGPGAWANTRRITVQVPGLQGTAGSFSLLVTDSADATVQEQSPDLTTQAAATAWAAQNSASFNIAVGGEAANPVAVVNSPAAGGADDRVNIVDANWVTALTRFTKDLGPGQVTQIGRTTAQAHTDTLAHAATNNRTAILDAPDTPTVSVATAAATSQRNGINDSYGGVFGPWVVIPGLTPYTTRVVPPSALVCAKIAASDALGQSPNAPAAGGNSPGGGVANYVIGLSQPAYDNGSGVDITRDAMYSLGFNQIAFRYGVYEVFGWRTLVDPNGPNQDWLNLGNRRLAMAMIAEGLAIAEDYILSEIDGQGRLFARYKGRLQAMCGRYYTLGSLYDGGTGKPEDAYTIDTGPTVNTPATISNKELHAAIAARMSQDAELVVLEIAKVPVSQSLTTA